MSLRISLIVAITLAFGPWQVQKPVFRSRTDLVLVNVSVIKGRDPMPGLTAKDFVLTDNGVAQDVEVVSAGELPVDVTVVMGAVPTSQLDALEASALRASRLRGLLKRGERLRMISAGDPIEEILEMSTSDNRSLSAGSPQRTRGSSIADALFYALAWPVDPVRRHLIVAFTNGLDTASTLDASILPTLASRSDAVFYAAMFAMPPEYPKTSRSSSLSSLLQAAGVSTPEAPLQDDTVERISSWRQSFRAVVAAAEGTGGAVQYNAAASVDSVHLALDQFRASYLLRYTPRPAGVRGWHEIRVTVPTADGATVRTRRGYDGG